MPTILGLSAYFHDSAAAIVSEGQLVAAAQEERFTRIKSDASFPYQAIKACLHTAQLDAEQIDAVAFHELPTLKFDRLLATFMEVAPRGFKTFRAAMPTWLHRKLRVNAALTGISGLSEKPFYCFPHHLSHAASAFFPSPFEAATIVTIDGVGEWATASIAHGRGNQVQPLHEMQFPHSLGLLYSAFTSYCGFEMNTGEYKLMGLAAYGKPSWADKILRDLVSVAEDGSLRLDLAYFGFCDSDRMTTPLFDRYFGRPPRSPAQPITELDCDLAASIQVITELVLQRMVRFACRLTGQQQVCLAGGVALNCVATGKLLEEVIAKQLWVQPAAGDAGGAVGAAYLVAHHVWGQARQVSPDDSFGAAFLGPTFSDPQIEQTLQSFGYAYERCTDDAELAQRVAAALAAGRVVGWFQDAMEFGPRALGNRSILADARDPAMKDRINAKIKHREEFRPFAPAVLRERANDYFAIADQAVRDLPYMTVAATCIQPTVLPAVAHLDQTARVQTVDPKRHPRFHRLLQAFAAQTSVPVLLNTSFNDRDEPIVCSPHDALLTFQKTGLDLLVMNRFLIEPEQQPTNLHVSTVKPNARMSLRERLDRWTLPIRWCGAYAALATVYFLLLTPLGCARRHLGTRRLDAHGWLPARAFKVDEAAQHQTAWWLDLILFLYHERQWWAIPIAVSLLLVTIAAGVGGAVAPLIYAMW